MKEIMKGKVFSGTIVETQENNKGVRYLSVRTTEVSDKEYALIAAYRHSLKITFTLSLVHRKDRATTTA